MTAQSASKETTLDLVDRQVETPVCAARRRRYWLVWWLWAVFGAAVSFRGMPAGGLLIAAAVLTAPFWVLFAAWPILWLRDRRRSKTLWAEETAVLLAPNPQQSASDSSADAQGGIALPVILGHERESSGAGILIPMLGWEAAFPTLDPKRMGFHLVAADTLPGVGPVRSVIWRLGGRLAGGSPLDGASADGACRQGVLKRSGEKNVRFAVKQRTGRCKSFMEVVSSEAHSLILFSKCLFASRTHGREYHDEKEKG